MSCLAMLEVVFSLISTCQIPSHLNNTRAFTTRYIKDDVSLAIQPSE